MIQRTEKCADEKGRTYFRCIEHPDNMLPVVLSDSPSALSIQIGGDHYKHFTAIQPVEFFEANEVPFTLANVIKYVLRNKDNRAQDLSKALHYLTLYKELRMDKHRHWRKILWDISPNEFITKNNLGDMPALVVMQVCMIATHSSPESCWEDAVGTLNQMIREL